MAFLPASWAQGIGVTPTFVPTYLENQKVKDSRFMSTRERKKQLCSASKIKHKKSTLWEANISTGYVFSHETENYWTTLSCLKNFVPDFFSLNSRTTLSYFFYRTRIYRSRVKHCGKIYHER